ncbi:ABC transporter permease [Brachybacterium muris]|uniref:ABC transporter permease n=1 Tax=Brachybacterium muris TaxID=219301 RepID=UPI0019563198|nr:ABC transporter permease [Brachybacterium muris]MBM7499451.1 putative ABC transport system permease protein [Brachybacterium muris]MCT1998924.1 ABC transporter permease [Brachybacterium muris]MCT2296524.1 ABC transporter permease [Brachybacterium muris]
MGGLRPILRLALRDAVRHRGRTALMLAIIALPIAVALIALSGVTPQVTSRDRALASIPDGTQAVISATTVGGPIRQLPEAITPMPRLTDASPATPEAIAAALPEGTVLHEWWNSPPLIATTALDIAPDQQRPAETGVVVGELDAAVLTTMSLREADAETLDLLLPSLTEGTAPQATEDVVLTVAAARTAGVGIGDEIQLIAPPDTGWRSTDGRVAAVVENAVRGYRVSGIVEGEDVQAWALPAWIAPAIGADQAGVDRHFLATGPAPITWAQVQELNGHGVGTISRGPLEDYPPADQLYPVPIDPQRALLSAMMLGATVMGMAALLIVLVTPALTVGAERMRRALGLVVAIGARPRDAGAMFLLQGAVLGMIGSLLGLLVALAALPLLRRLAAEVSYTGMGPVPWWGAVGLLAAGTALAVLASVPPARRVATADPVDALADRRPTVSDTPWRSRLITGIGVLLVTGGGVLALLASIAPASIALLVLLVGLLMLGLGTVIVVPTLIHLVGRVLGTAPGATMARAAAQDATRHLGRTAPAVIAVLACTASVALLTTVVGSRQSSELAAATSMITPGRAMIGMQTPISEEVDRAIIGSVLAELEADGLIRAHAPVYSMRDPGTWLEAAPAPGRACGTDEGPSFRSATEPGAPLECVPWDDAYHPGLSFPTWLGNQVTVLEPEAMRATGIPGAERAAQVLADGGVIVSDATRVGEDGLVDLRMIDGDDMAGTGRPLGAQAGMFLRGFEPTVALSPQTAEELGLDVRYVGEIVEPTHPLDGVASADFSDAALEITTVVWPATRPEPDVLGFVSYGRLPAQGAVVLVLLTALAIAATVLSVTLGRRETEADLATMQAVGASRGQVRRYGMTQALIVLAAGIPAGLAVGALVAVAMVGAMSRLDMFGPMPAVASLPVALGAGLLALTALTLISTLVLARPPRDLATRRRE